MSTKLLKMLAKPGVAKRLKLKRVGKTIESPWLLGQIKAAEPTIQLKSRSAPKALELWAMFLISTAPTSQVMKLLKILNVVVPALYGDAGGSAIQAMYMRLRKAIIDPQLQQAKMLVMRYDQAKWTAERKQYQQKVVRANKSTRPTTSTNAIDTTIDVGLTSNHWASMSVAAELASGARIVEILSMSTFTKAKKPGHIVQSHLAKKKDYAKDQTVTKPIIGMTVSQFLNLIEKIRANLPASVNKLEGYQLSHAVNSTVNKAVSKLLPGKTSHDLRKLYAARAWNEHGKDSGMSEAGFTGQILGHNPESLEVAASYTTQRVEQSGAGDKKRLIQERIDNLTSQLAETKTQADAAAVNAVEFDMSSVPINSKKRDGKVLERIDASVKAMNELAIPVTAKTLRSLGYGSSSITKYKKENGGKFG